MPDDNDLHQEFRPLLRLSGHETVIARDVAAYGYRGVVLDIVHHDPQLAAECSTQRVEYWLDISNLSIDGNEELRRWELYFEDDQPAPRRSLSPRFDIYNPLTAPWLAEKLLHIHRQAQVSFLWDMSEPVFEGETLPPFPWSPSLSEILPGDSAMALVTNTGKHAAKQRQEYWRALTELADKTASQVQEKCLNNKDFGLMVRRFASEWTALRLSPRLQVKLNLMTAGRDYDDWPFLVEGATSGNRLREYYSLLQSGAGATQTRQSPQSFTESEQLLNDACARARRSQFRGRARVGLLFPGRSAQTHYHPDGHRFTRWVSEDLNYIAGLLDDLHYHWVFVEETNLFPSAYQTELLILPSVPALGKATWEQIETFVERGGKVACLGLLPRWSENGRDNLFEEKVGKAALVSIEDLYGAYAAHESGGTMPPTIGFPVFREHISGGRLCCYQPRLNEDQDDARLRVHQILHESLISDFESQSHDVLYSHHMDISGQSHFFVHNAGHETQRVNMRLRPQLSGRGPLSIDTFDPTTGEQKPAQVWMSHIEDQGGGISLAIQLAAGEARWVNFSQTEGEAPPTHIERATFEVESFDGTTARGYAIETGIQKVAFRKAGKLFWKESDLVTLPSPFLLDDEWTEEPLAAGTAFSHDVPFPASWQHCRVFLEVAGEVPSLRVLIDGELCAHKISLPFRFDVSPAANRANHGGQSSQHRIAIEVEGPSDEPPLARLVAYPVVELKAEEENE